MLQILLTKDSFRSIYSFVFQIGETPLHVAVRHCHLSVAQELLRIVSETRSRIDAVMLVNQQNWVC